MKQSSLHDKCTIHKVLLVVPVNTLVNWEAEFAKWITGMNQKITVYNLGDGDKRFREKQVRKWADKGGVLITSDAVFRNLTKIEDLDTCLFSPGPDAVVVDERYVL